MQSSSIVIVVLLILSCNLLALGSQSQTVLLYSQKRFRGTPIAVNLSAGGCYRPSINVASINTAVNCIRVYAGRNCIGTSFDIYRRCNIDLGRCNIKKVESMTLC